MTDPCQDEPTNEDELRAFVARKLGDLQADFAKLIATLNLLVPERANQSSAMNRRLLYILLVLVILLYVLFAWHAGVTAGLFRG